MDGTAAFLFMASSKPQTLNLAPMSERYSHTPMTQFAKTIDEKLASWRPEVAAQVEPIVTQVMEFADANAVGLLPAHTVVQEVLDTWMKAKPGEVWLANLGSAAKISLDALCTLQVPLVARGYQRWRTKPRGTSYSYTTDVQSMSALNDSSRQSGSCCSRCAPTRYSPAWTVKSDVIVSPEIPQRRDARHGSSRWFIDGVPGRVSPRSL